MLPLPSPKTDDRAATRMLDLASALDAGLPPSSYGGEAADGDEVIVRALGRRQVQATAGEASALSAAWRAGRAPASLRQLAERRQQRAELSRQIRAQIRYPITLMAVACLVSFVTAQFGSYILPIVLVSVLGMLAFLTIYATRQIRRGTAFSLDLPLVGSLVAEMGEIHYLETLHACYASGVPLLRANLEAIQACPVIALRQKLEAADRMLQQGCRLTEALAHARAVHPETQHLVSSGETAGTLEESLGRAIARRRASVQQRARELCRWLGTACYALGVAAAIATLLTFWSGYAQLLPGIR